MKPKDVLGEISIAVVLQLGIPALLMLVLGTGATASAQVVANSADNIGPATFTDLQAATNMVRFHRGRSPCQSGDNRPPFHPTN